MSSPISRVLYDAINYKLSGEWSLIHNKKKQMFYLRETSMHCEVRGNCMCKEMPVSPVDRVDNTKKNNWNNWRTKEEERHKGSMGRAAMMGVDVAKLK
jgi:hypothetical protein